MCQGSLLLFHFLFYFIYFIDLVPFSQIYKYNDQSRKWVPGEALPNHREVIHDVSWAPNMGRSYHLIATASKDKCVRIFKLKEEPEKDRFKVDPVAEFDDHGAEVCFFKICALHPARHPKT